MATLTFSRAMCMTVRPRKSSIDCRCRMPTRGPLDTLLLMALTGFALIIGALTARLAYSIASASRGSCNGNIYTTVRRSTRCSALYVVLAAQPSKVHSLLPAKGGLTTFGWPHFADHSSTNRTRLDAHPQPNYHCAICLTVNIDKVVDKKEKKTSNWQQ